MPDHARRRTQHRDAFVAGLVTIADRADAHHAIGNALLQIGDLRQPVPDAAGQQHRACAPARAAAAGNEAVGVFFERIDAHPHRLHPVMRRLLAHAFEQVETGNAERKTRTVVTHRNVARTALATIGQHAAPVETRQIGGSGQAGRAAADDEAVEQFLLRAHAQFQLTGFGL
jgi:hypothetical protein